MSTPYLLVTYLTESLAFFARGYWHSSRDVEFQRIALPQTVLFPSAAATEKYTLV